MLPFAGIFLGCISHLLHAGEERDIIKDILYKDIAKIMPVLRVIDQIVNPRQTPLQEAKSWEYWCCRELTI